MKQNKRSDLRGGIGLLLAFALWTVLIRRIDVQAAGPNGTEIGFAAFNLWFHRLTGVRMALYTATDWLGLVPILVCMGFGGLGLWQLIRRRSLRRVDADLLLLGGYYVLVIAAYLLFEMFPINYRPILIEGRLEASYPSSTTLLVLSVMPTLRYQTARRCRNAKRRGAANTAALLFTVFMVAGRLISGVHWATDIAASVLLSAGLFLLYRAAVRCADGKRRNHGIQ